MSLQKIRDELIEYGKKRGEKWNFTTAKWKIGKKKSPSSIHCLDTFTLDYMVSAVAYFLDKYVKENKGRK
jgi:hypothetical protein